MLDRPNYDELRLYVRKNFASAQGDKAFLIKLINAIERLDKKKNG